MQRNELAHMLRKLQLRLVDHGVHQTSEIKQNFKSRIPELRRRAQCCSHVADKRELPMGCPRAFDLDRLRSESMCNRHMNTSG
jgi:hypothetical protein